MFSDVHVHILVCLDIHLDDNLLQVDDDERLFPDGRVQCASKAHSCEPQR